MHFVYSRYKLNCSFYAEFVCDVVRQTRARVSDPKFSVSVKIRIHDDLARTVDLCRYNSLHPLPGLISSQLFIMDTDSLTLISYFCRRMEAAGASFITVHGRTREQRGQPVNLEAIRTIKQVVSYLFLTFDDNEER